MSNKNEILFDIEISGEPSDDEYLKNLHFVISEGYEPLFVSSSFELKTQKLKKISTNYELLLLKNHNILVLDWDDTLFPTSFIRKGLLSIFDIDRIKKLENIVITLIKRLQKLGKVYIVTNASYIWFFYTAKIFYPRLFNKKLAIKVVSARDHYSEFDTMFWKIFCINHLFSHLVTNTENNINLICIGDSFDEHNACDQLFKITHHGTLKKIRFRNSPTILQLETELENTSKILPILCLISVNCNIEIENYKGMCFI